MNWLLLIIAGLCEIGFTICLGKAKDAEGPSFWIWICGFALFIVLSLSLLYKATQILPLGTAYAVWTGISVVGTVIVGVLFFKEPVNFWRIFFISH